MAEILGALSLGIDLGFDQPMSHVLRQCHIAIRLGELVDMEPVDLAATYYTALLVNVGCHTDAYEQAHWFGDDIAVKATKYDHEPFSISDAVAMLGMLGSGGTPLHRLRVGLDFAVSGRKDFDGMIEGHARRARLLGEELGMSAPVLAALAASYERWDGKGWPGDLAGDDIPLAARVAQFAEFLEVAHRGGGVDSARELAVRRARKQFDPALADVVATDAEKIFGDLDGIDAWGDVVDGRPGLDVDLSPAECDRALVAVSRFVDVKSPYLLGHSVAVAELAAAAARRARMPPGEVDALRRAALVSGFGRLGVSNGIWDKRGALTAGEWERVRLHPHLTERMLHQSDALAPLGRIAGQLRERLDGSGYPKGLDGTAIGVQGRLLAAADVYQSLREPRPHRPALSAADAADALRSEVRATRLDPSAVDAVLGAAGHRIPRRHDGPAGLTAREVEVLRLLVLGLTNREIATRLVISAKTAGNHVEHIYTKIGVSNRAAASIFAVRHGLLPEEGFAPA